MKPLIMRGLVIYTKRRQKYVRIRDTNASGLSNATLLPYLSLGPAARMGMHPAPDRVDFFKVAVGRRFVPGTPPHPLLHVQAGLIRRQIVQMQPLMRFDEYVHGVSFMPVGPVHIEPDPVSLQGSDGIRRHTVTVQTEHCPASPVPQQSECLGSDLAFTHPHHKSINARSDPRLSLARCRPNSPTPTTSAITPERVDCISCRGLIK